MIEETLQEPKLNRSPDLLVSGVTPLQVLTGGVDYETVSRFRNCVFSSLNELRRLRDWVESSAASGLRRGLALWALGRHAEAAPVLEEHRSNPAVANCLARSYTAVGRLREAERVLGRRQEDREQAGTWLGVLEARRDTNRLRTELARLERVATLADQKYYAGRIKEFDRDVHGAIALYDEALAIEEAHERALFRLAFNLDLRGEEEEARELYERALLHPPVNLACVINLGILYEDLGNFRRAMQCFDLALQTGPDNARARLFRRDAAASLNMYYDDEEEVQDSKLNKLLRIPIDDFELSVRSRTCLGKMNIRTLGDLVRKTETELLRFKNFGEASLIEIKEILKSRALCLGMTAQLIGKSLEESGGPHAFAEELPDPNSADPARRPVADLDLSLRSRRITDLLKAKTIGDLADKTEADLLACPNFGQTSLIEIKSKLDEHGLGLRF